MGTMGIMRKMEEKISNSRNYFNLRTANENLAQQNVQLRNKLDQLIKRDTSVFHPVSDSVYNQQFRYMSAEVINNSISRQKNFFTVDKGTKQGITPDMAVVTGNSVAGIIVGCSENYSLAMSLLNIDFKISARIKSNGYFGSLNWDGRNYRTAVLSEIPQHVRINVGDTIETTGYSAVIPEGIMIGTIKEFKKAGGDFYNIRILLETDFRRLQFVDVIGNLRKSEQLELEKMMQ
jgi:rod shape-determining protein MreC